MKQVLVLSGLSNNGRATSYADHFSEHIDKYEFYDINFDHLVAELSPDRFRVTDGRTGKSIDEYDLVIIREYKGHFLDLAYVVSKFLEASGTKFINRNYLTYRPISKIAQAVLFHQHRVSFPATYFSLSPDFLEKQIADLGYPVILKDTMGMHGSMNFLVQDRSQLHKHYSDNPDTKFIVQQFLPNDYDYRVLLMGDAEPIQIKRRGVAGSHLNNTSQGGIGELVSELPDSIIGDAKALAKAFGIDIAGVDVLKSQHDGKYYFLEINNQPQLVSGAEVEGKLAVFEIFLDELLK